MNGTLLVIFFALLIPFVLALKGHFHIKAHAFLTKRAYRGYILEMIFYEDWRAKFILSLPIPFINTSGLSPNKKASKLIDTGNYLLYFFYLMIIGFVLDGCI